MYILFYFLKGKRKREIYPKYDYPMQLGSGIIVHPKCRQNVWAGLSLQQLISINLVKTNFLSNCFGTLTIFLYYYYWSTF